jgi:hypothetical protein
MRHLLAATLVTMALAAASAAAAADESAWDAYLDYAYVYASAEPAALRARLEEYARETGVPFERVLADLGGDEGAGAPDETATRRRAVAWLLQYLATGDAEALERSVRAAHGLERWLGRHENRYWHHTVLAHHALAGGRRHDFVAEVLSLWLEVVVPLESPFETLQDLALYDSPSTGFVAALPHVYENLARLILIRSQEMGIDRDLDPLGAIVRMLLDGRLGAQPDVVPRQASARDYVERIVARLDGPESDAGSLTFTLALFEATRYHDRARGLLAEKGLAPETVEALRVAGGAYARALDRADTAQGRCAVHTRALRLQGEVWAAKQRLGADPDVSLPFDLEGAIAVYRELHRKEDGGWQELGYERVGRAAYLAAMRGLWEEIQEAGLNAADHYLAQAAARPESADANSRNAARVHARTLAFFREFATSAGDEGVPDSAWFAAHEAARGLGDAFFAFAVHPTQPEIELATQAYREALLLFPFERRLWPALGVALQNQGRESEYLALGRAVAERVTGSRVVDAWIEQRGPGAEQIAGVRAALANSEAIMHLGFAEELGVEDLERGLATLRADRDRARARLAALGGGEGPAQPAVAAPPAAGADVLEAHDRERERAEVEALLARLDAQVEARERALPAYRSARATQGLSDELRARRDHPVHGLLRRMYFEAR